jgi:large subunit ribosomal protein L30
MSEETGRKLAVKQVRSLSGRPEAHRRTMRALGFTKNQQTLFHVETPSIRGMLYQVRHLIEVSDAQEQDNG